MNFTSNDGSRPSKLELDRFHSGELSPEEADDLRSRLDDASKGHLAALDKTKAEVPPVDVEAIRARASALPPEVVAAADEPRRSANDNRAWYATLVTLIVAAIVLAMAVLGNPGDTVRLRTGDALTVHQLQGKRLFDYEAGTPVGEGDVLGFRVNATGHNGVVLLSVDGNGTVSVFFPAQGSDAEPISGDGFIGLKGTVTLDGAPGPEVFVAVFDRPVDEAKSEVQRAFQSGGYEGLVDWADHAPGADAVAVTRR